MLYLADILIVNHTYEAYINSIRTVMKIAKDHKIWCNINECQLMAAKMQIL